MNTQQVRKLFEDFSLTYDQERSRSIWKKQSQMFRDFWDNRIMSGSAELSEEEMQPIIWILDGKAKGIRNSGIKPAGNPFGITQYRWYRLFRELKSDDKLKSLVDRLFRSAADEEQARLINDIYQTYHNALTHKSANILNDLLFVFNPERETNIFSLNTRYRIINVFGLGMV